MGGAKVEAGMQQPGPGPIRQTVFLGTGCRTLIRTLMLMAKTCEYQSERTVLGAAEASEVAAENRQHGRSLQSDKQLIKFFHKKIKN